MKKNALSSLGRRTHEPPISWLMKMTLEHPKLISLAAGFTDSESLPVREARALTHTLLSNAAEPVAPPSNTAALLATRRSES